MTRGPDKQFDRDEALEKALSLFWERGYEATNLPQLLEHMGIGRQSLYNTYGDKKSLYLEALKRYFEVRSMMAREVLEAEGSPLMNLQRFFSLMIEKSEENGHCGCLMGNAVAEFGRTDPEIEKAINQFFGRVRAIFSETLARARAEGELPPTAKVEDLAEMLFATAQGLALMSRIQPDQGRDTRVLKAAMSLLLTASGRTNEAAGDVEN